jgi:hypothetical protein
MLHVHIRASFNAGQHVASINRQHKAAEGFQPALPWLLLHVDGRIRCFPTCSTARDEALKLWAPCSFTRH